MILFFLYYILGITQNFFFTVSIRFIDHDKAFSAALASFTVSFMGWMGLYYLFTNLDPSQSMKAIFSYASGIGTGTFLAMKFKLRYKGKDLIG